MSSGIGGLGTSTGTNVTSGNTSQNASGASNQASSTSPYAPSVNALSDILGQTQGLMGGGPGLQGPEKNVYANAFNSVAGLPNFGQTASNEANKFISSQGDPTGILKQQWSNVSPLASASLDPTQTPGMQNVLDTIQSDISNQINGQFAGAGRSLSGLNTQALSRGLAQGEAVPLLNQYNSNVANMLGANSQLGGISQSEVGNIGQGFNFANMAPGLATINPMTAESIYQQQRNQPYQYLQQGANLINPIAGMGGDVIGSQSQSQTGTGTSASNTQATATASALSQLAQALGLLGPIGNLAGTIL